MDVAARSAHERDPLVSERDQVVDGFADPDSIVDGDRRKGAAAAWFADRDGPEVQLADELQARVVTPKVGQEDAVDPPFAGQPPIGIGHGDLVVMDDLQHQRVSDRGELRLDAGDETREERVRAKERRIAGQDEPHREGFRAAHRTGTDAWPPAELVGGGDDPLACALGDASLSAYRERNGAVRDAGQARHVLDRRASSLPGEAHAAVIQVRSSSRMPACGCC